MFYDQIPAKIILFFIIYGITAAVPLIAALYLLMRKGNAFAPDVTPPLRLRRWAASFFAVSALGPVWWYLFLIYSHDNHSPCYVVTAMVDCFGMLTTITGTLLAMLQDRKRPVWPVVVALTPYLIIGALYIANPYDYFLTIAIGYILVLYVLFTVYMAFAVRRYGRWLRDNFADLERKEVWLSQLLSLVFMLLFILYALVDTNTIQIFLLHVVELVLFSFLLWRVETLPGLTTESLTTAPSTIEKGEDSSSAFVNIDLDRIEQLLSERCVDTKLYLQHDLTLQQLAHAVSTNRSYLSQYFSRQGITYNIYINNLRINHFISRYQEMAASGQTIVAQQLASESGYRSYSTFSLAFKQRTGQSVTAWIHEITK
jgi:AraC-like DNA-binding protein